MEHQMSFLSSLAVCVTATASMAHIYFSCTRLPRVFALIDAYNAQDPRTPPQELEYGQRMTKTLNTRYDPSAPEVVQIACRGQHIGRWILSRSDFPEGRTGYLTWRKTLYKEHARIMQTLLLNTQSYSHDEIVEICRLVGKQWDLKNDVQANAVEDVAALVFLEYYFPAFYEHLHDVDKMVSILRGTWKKMSDKGRSIALTLPLAPVQADIVKRALEEGGA